MLGLVIAGAGKSTVRSAEAQGRKPVLDQSNEAMSSLINGGSSAYRWGQGVTVGITGRLMEISLFVGLGESAPTPTQLWISQGAPGQSDPVWTTTEVLEPGWHTFNVMNAKIFVTAGDEFTIGIHGQNDHNNANPGFGISYDEQYPAGQLFMNGNIEPGSEAKDLLFQTMYIQNRPDDLRPERDLRAEMFRAYA